MRPGHLFAVVAFHACLAVSLGAEEPPALVKARVLYNAADYDGAIEAAAVARRDPQWSAAAALVIARSQLQRHRQSADPEVLTAARETLGEVRAGALTPRDQVDLLVGLGQALYLDERFGAAAELFDTALSHGELLSAKDRLLLLDWWATALDRDAQLRPLERRQSVYAQIRDRMEEALRRDAGSGPANYWLAVAARGVGDLDRAWHAAVAAWLRAGFTPGEAGDLREDLDRLVLEALIPERVRLRPPAEQEHAQAALQTEWEQFKQQWK